MKILLRSYLFVALFLCFACKDNDYQITQINEDIETSYNDFIKGYTSGIIQADDGIEIIFINLPNLDQLDPNKLITIKPDIEGEASWNGRTLQFYPKESWAAGVKYAAKVDINQVPAIKTKQKPFEFSFDIAQKSFSLSTIQLTNDNDQDLNTHVLEGILQFSEEVDDSQVEKALKIDGDYAIEWDHYSIEKKHRFLVKQIERQAESFDIKVKFSGEPFGIKKDFSQNITIPAIGVFQVLTHEVNNGSQQSVIINFSDPLDQGQETKGIVQFDKSINARYIIQGTQLKIYPEQRQVGEYSLTIHDHILNISDQKLDKIFSKKISFYDEKPGISLLKEGAIMPRSEGLKFPFRAVNVRAVKLRIVHIFEDNVAFFLQRNKLTESQEIKRAGRLVYNGVMHLNTKSPVDFHAWNNYAVNLEHYIDVEPGAIYRVYLSLDQAYSLYPCAGDSLSIETNDEKWSKNLNDSDKDYWNYYGYAAQRDWSIFRYQDRNNPCKPSYYMSDQSTVSQSIVASDLGIIAKIGKQGHVHVVVSDILTTKPRPGVKVNLFTFQNTLVGSGTTNGNGVVHIESSGQPYLLTAQDGPDVGYLKLDDGSTESVSMFQVEGRQNSDEINGFIYGERGVWRPGDSIFLQFIIQDLKNKLPADHPIVMEWYNPKGQLVNKYVRTSNDRIIHDFRLKTNTLDPTGSWRARINIGNSVFEKSIRVETIKPNRLKMDIEFQNEVVAIQDGELKGKLVSKWLHGANASGLEADVKLNITTGQTSFENYVGFRFDDATKSYSSSSKEIFKGKLDENGEATITTKVNPKNAPGMLTAQLTTRVFEQGGEFSIDRKVVKLSPYSAYVGIKMPEGTGWRGALRENDSKTARIALLDADGNAMNGKVEIAIIGLSWRWWYDSNRDESMTNFMRSKNHKLLKSDMITVANGEAFYDLPDLDYYSGYAILLKDSRGHSASATYRIYWNRSKNDEAESSKMLQFQLSQETYQVNEKIEVTIPSNGLGHFIVSLEHGNDVVKLKRVKAENESTTVSFQADRELIPNAYVYVAYIQPHAQTANDLPIRMYGVQPIFIEDASTHLEPTVMVADKWEPESEVDVTVGESTGQAMEYTLAIVDEGLLQLTRFATPDPWTAFHEKQALGVQTWDMYDEIIGAHAGEMAGLLAIGGDGANIKSGGVKANRFPPMVAFKGPFKLNAGESKKHKIKLPNYIGQVRVMVVAASDRAYGNAEENVEVKKPLMVLASLPRVVGPGETVSLPVTTFAMEPNIKNVNLSVKSGDLFSVTNARQTLSFSQTGDQVAYFPIKVADMIGQESVTVVAEGHGQRAEYKIDIDIRPANPPIHLVENTVLNPGESRNVDFVLPGLDGTNKISLEVANGIQFDLGKKGQKLFGYPHGCIEQTTSKAFPQLFLTNIMPLTDNQKSEIETAVKKGIKRLYSFQLRNGGLGYWPNATEASPWGTTYAGHFMLEAQKKGYTLPSGYLPNWISYQKSIANNWLPKNYGVNDHGYQWSHELMQAYRLYTLALADAPQVGAMNRLRAQSNLSQQAAWRLALAYELIGRSEVAKELIANQPTKVKSYRSNGRTFGSSDRDVAMILETLIAMEDWTRAYDVATRLATSWQSKNWYSTQSTSYILLAMFKFLKEQEKEPMNFDYALSGDDMKNVAQTNQLFVKELAAPNGNSQTMRLKNNSENKLFVKIVTEGVPLEGDEKLTNNNLNMSVAYENLAGKKIDVRQLERGTDFIAKVTIANPGLFGNLSEMALTQIFPSGWEIHNTRLDVVQNDNQSAMDYQDIRDDRIYTYFDIASKKSLSFNVELTATYPGRFYQPAIFCEAMYDRDVYALTPGQWVEVKD